MLAILKTKSPDFYGGLTAKRKEIYDAFLGILKDPEKQTKDELEKFKKYPKQETQEQQASLEKILRELNEQLQQLQDPNEKKTFAFVSNHSKKIFDNINPEDIKTLSEENFCELLLSVYKKIREENLADEKKIDKIPRVVNECVTDIRGTEAKDWAVGGIQRQIPGRKLLGKIPGLGKFLGSEEEKKEKPLSDEQMVTQFLRKSLLPIALFAVTLLIFGGGPIMTPIAIVGLLITEIKVVKSLFSNDKEGTLYNPYTTPEEKIDWGGKILNGVNDILKIPVKEVERGEKPNLEASEQLKVAQGVAQSRETITPLANGEESLWAERQNQRRRNSVTNSQSL